MTYWNAIFKEWQEMQQKFLDNLPAKLPGMNYPKPSMDQWQLPHLQTFMSWGQSAVKQSMELQTNWLDQWVGQMDSTIAASNENKADMIQRIQESMENWSENQSELWEYWFNMVEETAESTEDPIALFENISNWKSTVEETLESQSDWLNEWAKKIRIEELSPTELHNVSSQIQETMSGWLELQNELWDKWFVFLNLSDATVNKITAESTRPVKKKTVPKKVAPVENPMTKKVISEKIIKTDAKKVTPAKVKKKEITPEEAVAPAKQAVKDDLEVAPAKASVEKKTTPKKTTGVKEQEATPKNTVTEKKTTTPEKLTSPTEQTVEDDLKKISGIGPALAKKLNTSGIVNFSQLAALTDEEIDRLEETIIKFPGRIRREKWLDQAKKLLEDSNKS